MAIDGRPIDMPGSLMFRFRLSDGIGSPGRLGGMTREGSPGNGNPGILQRVANGHLGG